MKWANSMVPMCSSVNRRRDTCPRRSPGWTCWFRYLEHLYSNHLEQAELQLAREPFPLPKLVIKRKPKSLFAYRFEDFEFAGYQSHRGITAPVAV